LRKFARVVEGGAHFERDGMFADPPKGDRTTSTKIEATRAAPIGATPPVVVIIPPPKWWARTVLAAV
jgi:hypothetical protein